MTTKVLQLQLPSGRNIDYTVSGPTNGLPLIWFHGTPSACTLVPQLLPACEKKNLTLITFSRAGYGGTTRMKGRRVVDDVEDVQALLDHLGYKRFVAGGWSGGGPHVLACAARLPGCAAAAVIAGVAPWDAEGLDFLAGQGEDNIEEFGAALQGEAALQAYCAKARVEMLQADAAGLTALLSSILPEVDQKALRDSNEFASHLVDATAEALKNNSDGWVDDDLAFAAPWGFDVADVKCPIFLYQGSEDKMVPFSHGKWLGSHIPNVTTHLEEGEGHISIFFGRMDSMLDELIATAK